jgi:ABC-2 type transport system permease protein
MSVVSLDVGRMRAIARRQWLAFYRSPHRWFDMVAPGVDAVLIGTIGVVAAKQGAANQAGVPYLITGVLLFHILFQANLGLAVGFLDETWSRNVLNLMVTPLRELEFAIASALFGILKALMATVTVVIVALTLYSFDVTDVLVPLIPAAMLLIFLGWMLSMIVIGLVLRFGSGAEILTWILTFIIWPFSGVFYPVSALPGALQPIAMALPTTYAFKAARVVIGGGSFPWDTFAVSVALTVVAAVLAFWFLVRMLNRFRNEGYITRYS